MFELRATSRKLLLTILLFEIHDGGELRRYLERTETGSESLVFNCAHCRLLTEEAISETIITYLKHS